MYKYIGANGYKVTEENYFSEECNNHYTSSHTYINFHGTPVYKGCEAKTIDRNENPVDRTDNMIIGQYLDAYYEGKLEDFKANTPELFQKNGKMYAKFEKCEQMIKRCNDSEIFVKYMTGFKQSIYTGSFGGIDWKIKTDNLVVDKDNNILGIVDLKTCQDIHLKYGTFTWIEAYGYDIQLAIYQEIIKEKIGKYVPCYIAAVDKKDTPETAIIYLPDDHLQKIRELMLSDLERFKKVISREVEPSKCEECDYCISVRKNESEINLFDL